MFWPADSAAPFENYWKGNPSRSGVWVFPIDSLNMELSPNCAAWLDSPRNPSPRPPGNWREFPGPRKAPHSINAIPTSPQKKRLDVLLLEQGFAETRAKAQALIMAGRVLVDGVPVRKAGTLVNILKPVQVSAGLRFVSRGGEKLAGALDDFGLSPKGLVCLDAGASTGGFTDCLLQSGARLVYAVDVGTGQLHASLRADPR